MNLIIHDTIVLKNKNNSSTIKFSHFEEIQKISEIPEEVKKITIIHRIKNDFFPFDVLNFLNSTLLKNDYFLNYVNNQICVNDNKLTNIIFQIYFYGDINILFKQLSNQFIEQFSISNNIKNCSVDFIKQNEILNLVGGLI